jgi:hypothetical protein
MTENTDPLMNRGASLVRRPPILTCRSANRLLLAASVATLAIAMPGIALAQAVPAGCTPDPAVAGGTVTCLAPPTPISTIATTVADLTINVGDATTPTTVNNAAGDAIRMFGAGAQTLNIFNSGSSVSGAGDGVSIVVTSGVDDITLVSEGTISGLNGIAAVNNGTGGVTLNVVDVTGSSAPNAVAISAGTVGAEDISITSTGLVQGDIGIRATSSSFLGSIKINTVDVMAGALGIDSGGDDVAITSTGAVSGGSTGINVDVNGVLTIDVVDVTGGSADGISVRTLTSSTDLFITATGLVQGGDDGIDLPNIRGVGDLMIDVVDVTGGDDGIFITTLTNSADLSITSTGLIQGGSRGINATNSGLGALAINVADVAGSGGDGIYANNVAAGTDLSITATGAVTGGADGINARNAGAGALTINAVNVAGSSGSGISAVLDNTSTADISISATGAVSGLNGIAAVNNGTGGVTLNVVDVTGSSAPNAVAISAGTVGAEDISITSTGLVQGDIGIRATSSSFLGSIKINTVDVMAGALGIDSGGDDVAITSTGAVSGGSTGINVDVNGVLTIDVVDVTGGSADGISVRTLTSSTDLFITATGLVQGGDDGIDLPNIRGVGDLMIDVVDVTGGDDGIFITTLTNSADLSIRSTGLIQGGSRGINATNSGMGALAMNVADVAGLGDDGIYADNVAAGTDLSITATGTVTGGADGINAMSAGVNITTIDVSGSVNGASGNGISAQTANGASITLQTGASVTGGMAAIVTDGLTAGDAVDDVVTLNTGAAILSDVLLNNGNDIFNAAGGTYANVFGGGGADSVNFSGAGGAVNGLQEFEIFNFNVGGFDLTGAYAGLAQVNFLMGTNTLSGSLTSTATTVASGATLNAADGALLAGVLTNNGVLNIGASPGVFTITGDFVQSASGVLPIEIGAAASDLLIVTGNVTLAGALDVTLLGAVGTGAVTRTIIDGGGALTGAFDSANSGLLIAQTVVLDTANADVNLTTTINTASSVAGLTQNQTNVGDNLIGLLADPTLDLALAGLIGAAGALPTAQELADTLEDLHPESLDMGLKFLTAAQGSFLNMVIGQSQGTSRTNPVQIASLNSGPVSVADDADGASIWAAFQISNVDQNGGAEHLDFDGDTFSFMAGVSGIKAGPVSLGFAGGYSDFSGAADGALGDEIDSNIYQLALSLRAEINEGGKNGINGHIESAISYASGDSDIVMNVTDPISQSPVQQRGSGDISSIDWVARLTVDGMNGREWPIKPHLRVGVNQYNQGAVNIGLSSPTALVVEELDNTRGSIGIGASFGRQMNEHLALRASITGVQYFGDTQNVFSSRFASSPTGGGAFRTFGKEVDRQVELEAGFAYTNRSGFNFGAELFGEFGDLNSYGANVSVSKRF